MAKRHIAYISGTRADYGLMRNTLHEIAKHPKLKLSIIATGIHLMPEFGSTINEIRADGFDVHEIKATYDGDDRHAMSEFIGRFIIGLTEFFRQPANKPDILLVLGDRGEMLAAAIVGEYLGIPVAHIHGGDVTSTVDEAARHAITKLAHIHLAATKQSAQRIIRIGEEKKHVYVVGAPGLDEIRTLSISKSCLEKNLGIKLAEKFAIILYHAAGAANENPFLLIRSIIESVISQEIQAIIIYPNADAGGRKIIQAIEKFRGRPGISIFKTIPHHDFLCLMRYASLMAGNSSSGIIESASFKLPVLDIGNRQDKRLRADNVIHIDCQGSNKKDLADLKTRIKKAIREALFDKSYRTLLGKCKNPYGDGKTGKRIAEILSKEKLDDKLLQKQIKY